MNTKYLKAKILDLAIRGKLVPQDPSEGNATDLLQKIKKDKKSSFIIKVDDGRHYEQFADGTLKDIEADIPFEIPESWCWCRLGLILSIKSGDLIRVTENQVGEYPIYGGNGVNGYYSKYNVEANTIIIGRVGFYCGSIHITKERAWVTDNAFITSFDSNLIQGNFLFYLLQRLDLKNKSNSTAQPVVSGRGIYPIFVPLPPLAEQERIVSATEKAFEQIDIIEKNKLNLKNYIKQTKSKVLDLAIHGKLVEQNPQEGNAFELLEKIRNEKAEQVKQKKIKADKSASFIIKAEDGRHYEQFADGTLKDIEEEIPFEIPDSWCWCRLRNIGIYKKGPFGSALTKSMFVPKSDSTVKVYEQQNAIKKNHELGHYYIQSEYFESDMKGFEVHPGDVLVSCAGTIGETYILPENIERGIINQALMKMTISKELNIQFFLTYFDHILKTASDESGKGTAMKNIPPFDVFKQFLFPLPPLAEQQRIVAKIEQIFAQLDALEKALGD